MYANKIKLVGTENGVGVRNAGHIGAQAGDFTLSASGKLQNTGVITAQNVAVASQQAIENSGTVLAQKSLTLDSHGGITNSKQGQIIAGRDATLSAKTLHNDASSLLAAGVDDKGRLTSAGTLTLNGQQEIALKGQVVAKDSLHVTGNALDLEGVNAQASNVDVKASGALRTREANIVASGQALLAAKGDIDNQRGNISAGGLSISTSGSINNTDGRLVSQGDLSVDGLSLNNAGGIFAGQSQVSLHTGLVDNRQGILSGGTLDIDTQGADVLNQGSSSGQGIFAQHALLLNIGTLNNYQGDIQANAITLNTYLNAVDNTQGEILAEKTFSGLTGAWNNQQGRLQAGELLTLNAQGKGINNDNTLDGGLLSGGDLTLNSGLLSNQQGRLQSGGMAHLATTQLNNQSGQIAAEKSLEVNTQQQALANKKGTLASNGTLTLDGGDIDNTQGVVQGNAGVTVAAQQINNTAGTLLSQSDLQLTGTALRNADGVVQSLTDSVLTLTQDLSNAQGHILAGERLSIDAQSVDNAHGVLQGGGNVTLQSLNALNNVQGWVKANGALDISSVNIDNRETALAGLGIEGQSVTLNAATLNNQGGAVRAAQAISAEVALTLNNNQGMLSAGTQLTVSDKAQGQTLSLSNEQGVMVANGALDVNASQLNGAGKLVAQKNLSLSLRQAFDNAGRIQTGENLIINLAQEMTNSGLISSLGDVALTAKSFINTLTGEISSGQNTAMTTTGNLLNTGLIDGVNTTLRGGSLNNLGTGRIYGDALTLAFNTLVNDKQGDKAAVIAGRQSVDIAVSDLTNRDHALIYSDGDLAIGGSLDAASAANGRANSVKNYSASIEAAGNLMLKTNVLDNKDIHLQLSDDEVEVSREHFEWFDSGNGKRYKLQPRNGNADRFAINDDGTLNSSVKIGYESSNRWRMFDSGNVTKDFYQYVYDRTIYETQIQHQDAALITSGKNLSLDGSQLNNNNAHIVAGQNLVVTGTTLNNTETQGVRRTVDVGTTHYLHKGGGKWHTRDTESPYQGVNSQQLLSLNLMTVKDNAGGINATSLNAAQARPLDTVAGSVSSGQVSGNSGVKVVNATLKGREKVTIKTIKPPLTLPDNSLFRLNPASDSQYLVETDPRFTNKKKWLSSLDIVSSDQLEKRLGDGYYEQRLVREQLIATTGQRLSGNYQNDEEQYAALLSAGVAFGQQYQLTPGIALSDEQMAALTSDIVWMVNETVTLPDGRVEKVSVPQVYVRAKQGDLSGQGALLVGRQVSADITGALFNSGEVSSRAMTQLGAESIENSGRIQGMDITLEALKDINNIGGEIRGADSVSLNAGRDILSETGQRREGQAAWLDRQASIYVTGDKGRLTLMARQNVNLIASDIGNSGENGNTVISAGNDINLGTRDVSAAFDYTLNANNYYRGATSSEVGTDIHTAGDLTLLAGQDLSARAANVESGGNLVGQAGRNVVITAGEETADYTKHTKHTDKGMFSSTTKETHDESHSRTALSSTFIGDALALSAGNDINVSGSNVLGTSAVNLDAGNDINIGTVDEAVHTAHMSKTTKSGLMSSGGIGFTVGKQSLKQTNDIGSNQQKGSVIGVTGGNVVINAGKQVALSATDVVAGRAADDNDRKTGHIAITGSDIKILPGRERTTQDTRQSSKSSGLTISVADPIINGFRNIRDIANSDADGITKAKQFANEVAATGMDLSTGASLPLTYGKSSSNSESHYEGIFNSGSALNAAGNVQLTATGNGGHGDIVIVGSQVSAGEAVIMDAKRDVAIITSTDSEQQSSKASSKGWSMTDGIAGPGAASRALNGAPDNGNNILPYAMDKSNSRTNNSSSTENASLITGHDIYINSREGSVDIAGSSLTSMTDLLIGANKGNINITAGNDTVHQDRSGSHSMIGNLGGDGYSGMVGWRNETFSSTADSNQQSILRSQLASLNGNVSLQAGSDVAVHGADISAGKSLLVTGDNVLFDVSEDSLTNHSQSSSTEYALKGQVSGWVASAAQTAERSARALKDGRDPRLAGIYAAQAGLTVATRTMQGNMNPSAFKVSVSAAAGKTAEEHDYANSQQQGSTLHAGDSVVIKANNDIAGNGVDISGKTVMLDAGRDIVLNPSLQTESISNRQSGNQVSAGVGFSMGGSQNGFTGEFGYSENQSRDNGSSQTNQNSKIHADNILNIISGRDTTLNGAELSGDKVVADIGRNLTIASVQDIAKYGSKSTSSGVNLSVCVPPVCYGSVVEGSVSMDAQKLHNNFHSVTDQSGIYAGKGGFDITVGNHTQLDGAVIASEATADKNRLDTGTLGWNDIQNLSEWGGNQAGFAVSGGAAFDKDAQKYVPVSNGMPSTGFAMASGRDSGTTHSAIADGSIIIRGKDQQKQDVTALSRDTENANHSVKDGFDADKVKDRLDIQKEAIALGIQAANAYKTQMEYDAAKKNAALKNEISEANPGATKEAIDAAVKGDSRYIDVEKEYGPGSDFWRATSGATGLIAGILGGNIEGAAAAAVAPYMAKLVKDAAGDDNEVARIALHGIVSAALSEIQGGNALAAAAGGMASAAMSDKLAKAFYGKSADGLEGEQRTFISNLATAVGAAAGGSVGGDSFSAASGANAARVEVENNFLSNTSSEKRDALAEKVLKGDKSLQTAKEFLQLENADKRSDALIAKFNKEPAELSTAERTELVSYLKIYASDMQAKYGEAVTKELIAGMLTGQDYMKSAPQTEAQQKAQTIMNTWGYHKSNASIGDPVLLFGSSVLGTTIKEGMALNAAIGVGVNTGVQLSGNDPFSYVDAILAGVTAAATTGKSWQASAAINMGGAAIGSAIKGEDPTNSVISTGFGSAAGSLGGKVVDSLSPVTDQVTKDVIGAVTGSTASELTGKAVKDELDKREKKQ